MGNPLKNITGQVFGKLLVLEYMGRRCHDAVWKCQCECGNICYVLKGNLIRNKRNTRSCGCSWKIRGEKNCHWTGYNDISGRLWWVIQNNAKTRNLDFNLTIEYIWDLFLKQDKKCALSGLTIDVINSGTQRNNCICSGSLDRIDSSTGYVIGNVQWVHKLINRMKMDLSEHLFIKLCNLIGKNKKAGELTDIEIEELSKIIIRHKRPSKSRLTCKV